MVDSQGRVTITGHLGTGSPLMDAATVRYAAACPGDVNGDGIVDLSDLTILLSHFGEIGGSDPSHGDLNDDGPVNVIDLRLFQEELGQTNSPADFDHNGVVNNRDRLILIRHFDWLHQQA